MLRLMDAEAVAWRVKGGKGEVGVGQRVPTVRRGQASRRLDVYGVT